MNKLLQIGDLKIPAYENIKFSTEIDSTRFRVAVLVILGTYAVVLYIKTKHNEKKIKEITEGRSID